jgi:hypothetical protein
MSNLDDRRRVEHGGSWRSLAPKATGSVYRSDDEPTFRLSSLGFRTALAGRCRRKGAEPRKETP